MLATHVTFSHCYPPLIYYFTERSLFKKCPPTGKSLKKALLTEMCVNDLCRIINAEKVFTILNNAICFDEQELHKACWHFIERYASDVVSAESFNNITLETLMTLVNRDKLDIPEVKLFQAVLKWSEVQCEQQNLTPTAENKKSVMGDAIYAIKYLSRSQKDFAQHVSRSGLFSDKELVSIYGTLNGLDSALEWSPSKRKLPLKTIKVSHNNVRFNRFNRGYENEWRYDCWEPDRICFSVSKDALFHGTRLFGNRQKGIFDVTLEIKGAKVCGKYSADGNDRFCGFDVMLESPIVIEANEVVTLTARIKGQSSNMGILGKISVECHGVLVKFSGAHSPNHQNNAWKGQLV
jgi:BTB/POZ domain-containing protein 1/2